MTKLMCVLGVIPLFAAAAIPVSVTTETGSRLACGENVRNFTLTAKVVSEAAAEARRTRPPSALLATRIVDCDVGTMSITRLAVVVQEDAEVVK